MDLFSFSCFPPSSESSPMSIGLDIGELDSYLNNTFTSTPLELHHQNNLQHHQPQHIFPPPFDFPEYQIRNYHYQLSSTEGPINGIDYGYNLVNNNEIEDFTILNAVPLPESPIPSLIEVKEEPKKRKRRPEPMTDVCRICGDIAPPHNHYGAIACFSCRAFFGRTVHKGTQERFRCVRGNPDESGQCMITKATRTHCQFCRYRGCLSAGMKPSYVTTAEERLQKKKNSKRGKKLVIKLDIKEEIDYGDFPTFRVIADINIPLTSSGSYPTMCFMIEQNRRVEHRIQCRNFTWHSIAVGVSLMMELIRVGSKCLAPSNDIEIEVQFNENNKSIISGVTNIPNTDPVLRVNVSSVFSARVGLKEQLLETIGSKDYIVQKTPYPNMAQDTILSMKQVFTNPWGDGGLSRDCVNKFDNILEKMEKLNLDRKIECLLSVIPFFAGTDNPYETELLSKVQEEINMVLFQHVYESAGPRDGKTLFSKIMSIIVDLQEIVTLCRKKALDFKIASCGIS
uniref:Vitamin D3 receptorlike [Metaseiulus occidentalis] n=1 Tax=Lepeophtheirus salmonis TaxID=72036 RepID=A0A0K2TWN4_LEPSM